MRITNLRLLTAILAVLTMVFVPSCKDDDNSKTISTTTPVLNENFFYTNSDANTFVFTTTLAASNMWITNCATEVASDFVDNACSLSLYIKGDYKLVCGALVDGVEYVSDTFSVNVASTNTTFLETGLWKALTGGPSGNKVWKLDIGSVTTKTIGNDGVESSTTSYASSFFHNPLDFYGDAEAGGSSDNVWGPWGGTNFYGWGGAPESGNITFDGTTGIATLVLTDGVNADGDQHVTTTTNTDGSYSYTANPTARVGTFTGAFAMVVSERDANFCTISAKNSGIGAECSLWDYMLANKYKYLGALSAQTGKIIFTGDMRFPLDKGRVGENQFLASDLKKVMVIHCDDSSLIVRVKRTYEGFSDATTHKSSSCWLLYNFIADGYKYTPTVYYNTAVLNSSATASTLVGTWKFDGITGDWIGWSSLDRLNKYTASTEASNFEGWGDVNTTQKYAAALKCSYTFKSDGTYTFTDVVYDASSLTETTNTYTGTYTVNKGYITFSSSVAMTGFDGRLNLSGLNMYVINNPATGTSGTLWIGQNNGTNYESVAVQLVKQ
jgi:hypothetical protein